MHVTYLFNSSGFWIAYREGDYVFDPEGHWVGWRAWQDDEVVDTRGTYLGHIVHGSRLYRKDPKYQSNRSIMTVPEVPRYRRVPEPPNPEGRELLPIGCHDIRLSTSFS